MKYKVTLTDLAERRARIDAALESPLAFEDFDFFRDQQLKLPAIRIPLHLPVYRMGNLRTYTDQAEHVAREKVPPGYFETGQETESIQQIQHEILARLAAKGKANSVVPVIDVLEREGQREKLLVTRGGVVVNGNRRLAAMRELFKGNEEQFSHFSHVNCLVLPPDTTEDDILEIEGILQARPETRLDYDWIGDAQLLSKLLRKRGTPDAVAKRLGRKATEVKNAMQALAEADLYLKDWVKAPGEYRRVAEDGEQLFKDMPGLISSKAPALQEASRAIAWSLFDNRKKLEGRIYNYNLVIGKAATDVLDRLSEEFGVSTDGNGRQEDGEDFDFDFGEDESSTASYEKVLLLLRDQSTRDEVAESLVEICTSIVESERDKKSGNAALKAVTSANTKLAEVDLGRAEPATFESIQHQLAAIAVRVEKLRASLAEILQTRQDDKP